MEEGGMLPCCAAEGDGTVSLSCHAPVASLCAMLGSLKRAAWKATTLMTLHTPLHRWSSLLAARIHRKHVDDRCLPSQLRLGLIDHRLSRYTVVIDN